MLDYVDSKERQGIFFEKPSEKIHLPEAAELALTDHTKYKQIVKLLTIFHRGVLFEFHLKFWNTTIIGIPVRSLL